MRRQRRRRVRRGLEMLAIQLMLAGIAAAADGGAARQDWACWRGPLSSGAVPAPPGMTMITNPAAFSLVWESEAVVPLGWVHPTGTGGRGISGGYAGPVVAGDGVYLYYYRPSGPLATNTMAKAKDKRTQKWGVLADDVLLCIDAETGKTRWETVFKETGINQNAHNHGILCTPCVSGDTVLVQGCGGWVFGVHRVSGKELWRRELGRTAERAALRKKPGKASNVRFAGVSSPAAAEGVAMMEDSVGNYFGLAVDSGKVLWGPLKLGGRNHKSPLVWRHDGRSYFVLLNRLLDPKTGEDATKLPGHFARYPLCAIEGDLAVDNAAGGWRLSLDGAKRLYPAPWMKDKKELSRHDIGMRSPAIINGVVFAETARKNTPRLPRDRIFTIDLKTGVVRHARSGISYQNEASSVVAHGGIIFGNGQAKCVVYRIGDDLEPEPLGSFDPGGLGTHAPAVCRGRLYVRGKDRVRCFQIAR